MEAIEKYLVIGGDGFLGRHIVKALLDRHEAHVGVLDIVQSEKDDGATRFFKGDITVKETIVDAIQQVSLPSLILLVLIHP